MDKRIALLQQFANYYGELEPTDVNKAKKEVYELAVKVVSCSKAAGDEKNRHLLAKDTPQTALG